MRASLDLPTSSDIATLEKLSEFRDGARSPWTLVNSLVLFWSIFIQLASQVWVLLHLLKDQPNSSWLVIGSFADPVIRWFQRNNTACMYVCEVFDRHSRQAVLL